MNRLYLDHPLAEGEQVPLSREQAHYLSAVMRMAPGDRLEVFDGRSGAFGAEIVAASKRGGALRIGAMSRPLQAPPDLWLLFAPVKKTRTDFIVEKAVELGARRICPVQTLRTNAERIRRDRLQAHAVEAAEQCGATVVPEVAELVRLETLLADWPAARHLMFCDEGMAGAEGGPGPAESLSASGKGPWAILIGPEGGFAETERAALHGLAQAVPVRLGPRILRAETAAVAALTLWQASLGDWT